MSTYIIKCWVSGVVQSSEAGRMVFVRTRLTEASSFLCFDSFFSLRIFRNNFCTLECRSNLRCVLAGVYLQALDLVVGQVGLIIDLLEVNVSVRIGLGHDEGVLSFKGLG